MKRPGRPLPSCLGVQALRLALLAAIATVLLGSGTARAAAPGQEENPSTEADAADASADAPRDLSRGEMQRLIDVLQRQVEDLNARIGDKPPDSKQQQTLDELQEQIATLQARIDETTIEKKRQALTAGHGVKAKWLKLRESLRDFVNYDVNDGMFRIRLGVRLQLDTTLGSQTSELDQLVGPIEDSFDARRGRIFAEGRILRSTDFKFEYDFAADFGLKDAYLEGAKFTKYVRWRVGHFKEPFSFARQTSGNDLGFLEWAAPVPAIAPGRNWGLMFRHSELKQRMTWAAAITTKGQVTDDNRTDSKISFTARATGLPIYRNGGRRLLHLGAAYSIRDLSGDTQVAARPESRFVGFYVDTGSFETDGATLLGGEVAGVAGRFWAQAEYLRSEFDSSSVGDPVFDGAYLEVGYFLTGESRTYDPIEGIFGRLVPNKVFHGGNPFTGKGDGGALEVTGRYSGLDLNDGLINGGRMTDVSLGLNWYPTLTTRVMANYIRSDVKDVGTANIFLLRFQFNP